MSPTLFRTPVLGGCVLAEQAPLEPAPEGFFSAASHELRGLDRRDPDHTDESAVVDVVLSHRESDIGLTRF